MVQNVPGARIINPTGFLNPARRALGMQPTHSILPFLFGSLREGWQNAWKGELTPNVESMIVSSVIGHSKRWGAERILSDVNDIPMSYKPPWLIAAADLREAWRTRDRGLLNYRERFRNDWMPELVKYAKGEKALKDLDIPDWLRRRVQNSTETERMMRAVGLNWNLNPKSFEREFVNPMQETFDFIEGKIFRKTLSGLERFGKFSELAL